MEVKRVRIEVVAPEGSLEIRVRDGGRRIFGILRGWKINPQEAKDELRRIHGG